MLSKRASSWLLAAVVVAVAGCGGGSDHSTGAKDLSTLRGKTIGLVALDSVASLELRYVLQEAAGVDSRALGGDVRYAEAPADSLPGMLERGEVAAALLPPQAAFSLVGDASLGIKAHLAEAMRDLTGSPVMATALLTFRDEADANSDALTAARRMMSQATSYFDANRSDVLESIVSDQSLDEDQVRWQVERQRIVFGDSSRRAQRALAALWDAAVVTGDITDSPSLDDVLFSDSSGRREDNGRQTVSLAVLDDAGRRAALYAIEQGIVTSNLVDLDITYLSSSLLGQALAAREYDIVEGSPILVATMKSQRLDLVVLSGAVEDADSTLLFDYRGVD